jgi:hypothetical protein
VLNSWKAYATRGLWEAGIVEANRIVWTAGGCDEALRSANRYVLEKQGEPMAWYGADPKLSPP